MSIIQGTSKSAGGAAPFNTTLIPNSVWLDGSADFLSAELGAKTRTKAVIGTWFQKTGFTTSDATIFSKKSGSTGEFAMRMQDQASKAGLISIFDHDGSNFQYIAESSGMVLRDIGWYHIMISIDTTAAGGSRLKYFINGIDQTSTLTISTDYTASDNPRITGGSGAPTQWGVGTGGSSQFSPMYLAQAFMLDDDSIQNGDVAVSDILDSFTYGTNGSQFVPKANADIATLASSAGGDSFCLDFANSSDLGNDISSNNNDFSPQSMAAVNQSTNTPSLVFSTYNILDANPAFTSTNEGANTYVVTNIGGAGMRSTMPMTTGKWYWEQRNDGSAETGPAISAGQGHVNIHTNSAIGVISGSTSAYLAVTNVVRMNGSETGSLGLTNGASAVMGTAFDADTGKVWFRDSSGFGSSGNPATGANPHITLDATKGPYFIATRVGGAVPECFLNAGGNPTFNGKESAGTNADENGFGLFKLGAVPTGFLTLCSANLPAPEFQGKDFFDATLYEGNGQNQRVGDFVPFTDSFNVAKSAMFEHADVRALKRTAGTPSSSGGKKGTWSVWYKTGLIDTDNIFFDNGTTATTRFSLQMDASGQITFSHGGTSILVTNADLKGGGFWRNLVLRVDTSQSTATDRALMYIDGVLVTSFATDGRASLGLNAELGYMDSGATQFVGSFNGVTANQWDGYLAETVFLDNQFLSASSFGQLDTSTNRWVPKAVTGLTLGDQGFYLAYGGNFGSSNGAGDSTGNSNNLTEIGTWTATDQFVDTPSKNFTTFDPGYSGGGSNVWSEGNTKVKGTDGTNADSSTTTFGMTGKVVFQFQINALDGDGRNEYPIVGFITSQSGLSAINATGSITIETIPGSFSYSSLGTSRIPASTESTVFAATTGLQALDPDDVLRFEVDTDAGTVRVFFQNEGSGSFSEITGARVDNFSFDPSFGIRPAVSGFSNSIVTLQTGGQTTLASVTTGFLELNQDNLDDTQSKLTALAWIKNRDATDNHMLANRVRGPQFINNSNSNSTGETTNTNAIQRFLQRGVQVGSDVAVNTAHESFVLWQWLMGDSATTGSTTNPAGSIASTTIVSDANHMSIGTFTGTGSNGTVGHGLSAAPEAFVVFNPIADARFKMFFHKDSNASPASGYVHLESTEDFTSDATVFNSTVPTATVFSVGTNGSINENTKLNTFITWRSIPGVCKVGSYIGNGSTNGPYISTGFKPRWVIYRVVDSGTNAFAWTIVDTVRSPINGPNSQVLHPNLNSADSSGSGNTIDILSDGFKRRDSHNSVNQSGKTYIYIAMADIGGNGTLPPIYAR